MNNLYRVRSEYDLNELLKLNTTNLVVIFFTSDNLKAEENNKFKNFMIKYSQIYFNALFVYINILDYKTKNKLFTVNQIPTTCIIYKNDLLCSLVGFYVEDVEKYFNMCYNKFITLKPVEFHKMRK